MQSKEKVIKSKVQAINPTRITIITKEVTFCKSPKELDEEGENMDYACEQLFKSLEISQIPDIDI